MSLNSRVGCTRVHCGASIRVRAPSSSAPQRGFQNRGHWSRQQCGVSVAAVARARGINANLLRRWVRAAEHRNRPIAVRPTVPTVETSESFVPLAIPATSAQQGPIRIELRRKGRSVSIEWLVTAAQECALLLRELMK